MNLTVSLGRSIYNRSPLRYPGGKSRAAQQIFDKYILPHNPKTLCSPFFGGGSIEIICANHDINVFGYDSFLPLAEFWQCLLEDSTKLATEVAKYFELPDKPFDESYKNFQQSINSPENTGEQKWQKYERAAIFYVINRTSFSGSSFSGGRSPGNARFTEKSIENLLDFKINNTKKLYVLPLDFRESIIQNKKSFFYLDPPYWIENKLYGNNGDTHFEKNDHIELAEILSTLKTKWVLSYNDNELVRKLYSKFNIDKLNWSYGMKNVNSNIMGKSQELIITNFES